MVGPEETGIKKWESALSLVQGYLREEFHRLHPFKDDGDVSPSIIALRDAVHAFPFAVDVLLIDIGSAKPVPHIASNFMDANACPGSIWTLIAHYLDDPLRKRITFYGTRALADLESFAPLLAESFGIDDEHSLKSIRELNYSGYWTLDASMIVDLVPYDVRSQAASYARYLFYNILGQQAEALIGRFERKIDFNAIYGLESDPILSLEELTKIDSMTACFVKLTDGSPPSIEERQEDVRHIQLIPKVPEDVRLTFRRAKIAYVYGYFQYDLFTIAVHYAALALEAAIKARWSASLPPKVTVSCVDAKIEMQFPSHTKISRLCRNNRWRGRPLLIEGQRFPSSMNALLDWLQNERIVGKWEREGLKVFLDMRNAFSHLEQSSTDMPSPDKLQFVADLINKLFHSLQ